MKSVAPGNHPAPVDEIDAARHRRAEALADARIAALDGQPVALESARDVVVLLDGCAAPFIIPPQHRDFALRVLGGRSLADEIAALPPRPSHVLVVVVIDGLAQVAWIGVRRLVRGGVA